jgi:hypothetical protein
LPGNVGQGVINDAAGRSSHEVDVVVTGLGDGRPPLLAIGEAKWNEVMGVRHLERLRHIRHLLEAHGKYDVSSTRLACFSGAGFTDELHGIAAEDDRILLVSPEDLFS